MKKPWYANLFARRPQPELESTKARARQGDVDAQFALGVKYSTAEPDDFPQAAHWYRLAAGQGHPQAQFNLGVMYAAGQGMPKDDAESAQWFLKAAQQGDPGAQHRLGVRQVRASRAAGLPADAQECRIEAYKWYQLAAAQGYRGSDAGRESVNMDMTHDELADAERRVAAFVAVPFLAG